MTKNMYFTALEVKKLLTECKGVSSEWPPDSQDLTLSLTRQSIPVKLYNFLAWCVGFSSDPVKDDRVEISSSEDANIVSIAQDLVYAEPKGRKQTHKSLALGMTVWQMMTAQNPSWFRAYSINSHCLPTRYCIGHSK